MQIHIIQEYLAPENALKSAQDMELVTSKSIQDMKLVTPKSIQDNRVSHFQVDPAWSKSLPNRPYTVNVTHYT